MFVKHSDLKKEVAEVELNKQRMESQLREGATLSGTVTTLRHQLADLEASNRMLEQLAEQQTKKINALSKLAYTLSWAML